MRAGLQTRARFTMTGCLSGEPVRRVKLESVGRLVNPGRIDYRARVWRPARTELSWMVDLRSKFLERIQNKNLGIQR